MHRRGIFPADCYVTKSCGTNPGHVNNRALYVAVYVAVYVALYVALYVAVYVAVYVAL